MGDKKQKEASQKRWKKVLFIIAAVLFVVVMVVSSMGSHWITGLAPVKAGDAVVIDYTIYDAAGNPVVTTSQELFKQVQHQRVNPVCETDLPDCQPVAETGHLPDTGLCSPNGNL